MKQARHQLASFKTVSKKIHQYLQKVEGKALPLKKKKKLISNALCSRIQVKNKALFASQQNLEL
jgi:hypothetical protein